MNFITFYGLYVGVYNVTAEAGRVKGTLNGLKNESGSAQLETSHQLLLSKTKN